MKVVLELTSEEAEKLFDVLLDSQDAGPMGQGWKSELLQNLISKVKTAIEAAEAA